MNESDRHAPYHRYVFDLEQRSFVGRFEEMYADAQREGFDPWHERDLRMLRKRLSLAVLEQSNWARVLDVGCGTGTISHLLKRVNNEVVGIDMSESALARARASYPDIRFDRVDLARFDSASLGAFDLAVVMATLAYVEEWPRLIESLAKCARWLWVSEYIPPEPIGFVRSGEELFDVVGRHFQIRTRLVLDGETFMCLAERLG